MNKYIIIFSLLSIISSQSVYAQDRESPDTVLQKVSAGGIREEDAQSLQKHDAYVAKWLADAPNDLSGKKSPLYPKLQAWSVNLHKFASSRKQNDAFDMVPMMVDIFRANKPNEIGSDALKQVMYQMNDCGFHLIMAAGAYIQQHNGDVPPELLAKFVQLFSVRGFDLDSAWEDETCPIDPGGLTIINPAAVVRQLKAGPWQEAKQFVGGNTSADEFFGRYLPNGNDPRGTGLAALKSKYAANKDEIDAKFNELLAWVQQQEALQEKK